MPQDNTRPELTHDLIREGAVSWWGNKTLEMIQALFLSQRLSDNRIVCILSGGVKPCNLATLL